jgi:protein SCO1/2
MKERMKEKLNRLWMVALPVLVVAATLAAVFTLRGGFAHPARGGDFTLTSINGDTSLHDFRGKFVFIYFGYTFCPDACPTSLATLAQAFREFNPEELEQVQGLFISVDPDRDTPQRLKEFSAYFHPKILGLTGSSMDLALISSRYGATYRAQKVASAAGYLVDHSSVIYLVDPKGELVNEFPYGVSAAEIVTGFRSHQTK